MIQINVPIPNNCDECFALDDAFICCLLNECLHHTELSKRREDCPMTEISPHGDLIDKGVLFRKIAELAEKAVSNAEKCKDDFEEWKICAVQSLERVALKHLVADSPVVIPAFKETES